MIQPRAGKKLQLEDHPIKLAVKKRLGRKIRLRNPEAFPVVGKRQGAGEAAHGPQRFRWGAENFEVGRPQSSALKSAYDFDEVRRVHVDR